MNHPDWVSEALWEKAEQVALSALATSAYETVGQNDAAISCARLAIARALIQAKNEGKREAAEIASRNHGDGVFNAYENGRRDAAQAILSSLQKEPT